MTGADARLTPEQAGLWYEEQVSDVPSLYTEPTAILIEGPLDAARLRAAAAAVLGSRPALGAAVRVRAGWPVLADPGGRVDAVLEDLPLPPGAEAADVLRERALALWRDGIDPDRGPLAAVRIQRIARDLHGFVLLAHHVVVDGWSTRLLVRDIARAYASGEAPAAPRHDRAPAPPRMPPARPFAGPAPEDPFPAAGAAPRGASLPPTALPDGVDEAALRFAVTPFTLHMAAFQEALHQVVGVRTFLVGFPDAGRGRHDGDRVDSMVRMRAVLARVPVGGLRAEHLEEVCEAVFDGLEGPALDPATLRAMAQAGQSPPSAVLALDTVPALDLPGCSTRWLPLAPPRARFPLGFLLFREEHAAGGRTWLVVEYDAARVGDRTARELADRYATVLAGLRAQPGAGTAAGPGGDG